MTICIIGDPEDLTSVYVGWVAQQLHQDILFLAERDVGVAWRYTFQDATFADGSLWHQGCRYPFRDITGAFIRLNPTPGIPPSIAVPSDLESIFIRERRQGLYYWLDNAPFALANRPLSGRNNGSKPLQMHALAQAGFAVPPWIVSNSPQKAQEFVDHYQGNVIYKSCSGLRSRVRKVDKTLQLRLESGTTPPLLQTYIPGKDVRVHVVREHVFPTEVQSEAVDYRFDGTEVAYQAIEMPWALAQKCIDFTYREDLLLSGFDFRVTPKNEWYCLEMNPVPTFMPYELATGQPIGKAIIQTLIDQ